MTLTQEQLDNLVTLLKSEDIEYIQQGTTLVDTLVEAGTIGEEEFIRIIEEVTGGVILSDEQYAECAEKLNDLSNIVMGQPFNGSVPNILHTCYDRPVIQDINLTSLKKLFNDHIHCTFMSLWSLGNLAIWPEKIAQIAKLSLEFNELTTLPESFENLTTLTDLRLGGNQLTTLPKSIGNLTNLTTLNLYSNRLTTLPESLGKLTNLTWLNLNANQLTTLPESFGNLTNLTRLYLRKNQLTTLPESIENLTNLTFLDLSDSPISESELERIQALLPNCEIDF